MKCDHTYNSRRNPVTLSISKLILAQYATTGVLVTHPSTVSTDKRTLHTLHIKIHQIFKQKLFLRCKLEN